MKRNKRYLSLKFILKKKKKRFLILSNQLISHQNSTLIASFAEYCKTLKYKEALALNCLLSISLQLTEAAVCRYSSKQMFCKTSQCSQETPVLESIFYKVADMKTCNFI